jgi:hypothetical protein
MRAMMPTLRSTLLCLAVLAPVAAQAVPLAPIPFTEYVRTELARATHAPVAVRGPLTLSIHYDEGIDRLADLGHLHARCFRAAGQCRAIVAGYVRDVGRQIARIARDRSR